MDTNRRNRGNTRRSDSNGILYREGMSAHRASVLSLQPRLDAIHVVVVITWQLCGLVLYVEVIHTHRAGGVLVDRLLGEDYSREVIYSLLGSGGSMRLLRHEEVIEEVVGVALSTVHCNDDDNRR